MNLRKLLMLVFLAVAVCVMSAGAGGAAVITVDDSGGADFTSIQAAVYAAAVGDTIEVRSGTYVENVDVRKQLTLRGIDTGAGMPVVDAFDKGDAITLRYANGITLEGFVTTNASSYKRGIYLYDSNDNTLSGNYAMNNKVGIGLLVSNNNTLTGNTGTNNYIGIHLYCSDNNFVSDNNLTNSYYGIEVGTSSNNNMLISNDVTNNTYGIHITVANQHSTSSNNMLNGNNVVNNKFGIVLDSSNNALHGNNVTNNEWAIFLRSNNNTLDNNNFTNNKWGIRFEHSSNNTLRGNDMRNYWHIGLEIYNNSNNNTLYQNNFDDAYNYDYGTNQWDSGTVGNYWGDKYTGTDSDGDGIGDIPYDIPGGSSVDRYPLMTPYTTQLQEIPNCFYGNVTIDGVDAPVGTVINAYIDGTLGGTITIFTEGEYGYTGNYLEVFDTSGVDDGLEITFTISGYDAQETSIWIPFAGIRKLDLSTGDISAPNIDSAAFDDPTPNTGDSINLIVVATDDVEVTSVTANGDPMTNTGGDTWELAVTAVEGISKLYGNNTASNNPG